MYCKLGLKKDCDACGKCCPSDRERIGHCYRCGEDIYADDKHFAQDGIMYCENCEDELYVI